MKKILALILAVVFVSLVSPTVSSAEPAQQPMLVKLMSLSTKSEAPANMSVRPQRTVQAWGGICRNGFYYCTGIGTGLIGYPCCGCGFCGAWSSW